jgi:hypothetical protein
MFEEIPLQRRGLARISARRYVLGHFVVGGGVVLATLGGSVAAVATVIAASTIGIPPGGPSRAHHAAAPAATVSATQMRSTSAASSGGSPGPGATAASTSGVRGTGGSGTSGSGTATPGRHLQPTIPANQVNSGGGSGGATSAPSDGSTIAVPPPLPSAPSGGGTGVPPDSQPSGNALVYIRGFDASRGTVLFQYATVQPGAGPGGSDLYSVLPGSIYRAPLSAAIRIVSGDTMCPPSGSPCTAAQLVVAAADGFFAEVGIDASGALRSVIERDNAGSFSAVQPSSAPSGSDSEGGQAPASPAVAGH